MATRGREPAAGLVLSTIPAAVVLDDEREVTRLAGVVEAARAIEPAGARPEIDQVRTPSTPPRFRERPARVAGLGSSFESVQHHQPRSVGGRPIEAVELQYVVVRRGEALPAGFHHGNPASEPPPQRP